MHAEKCMHLMWFSLRIMRKLKGENPKSALEVSDCQTDAAAVDVCFLSMCLWNIFVVSVFFFFGMINCVPILRPFQ